MLGDEADDLAVGDCRQHWTLSDWGTGDLGAWDWRLSSWGLEMMLEP